ncbi:MAG: glycine cleavage system aminomethyltransferase GcvT [Burkholderiales bacterium]|jgi:aminomethyltransferase|nr:glycine cleavage system aminomethyltransferase GcvT [Burkholderiales bacterium]
MTLKQTSLHSVHAAAGAKLVDFGGWDMPLHYGSQLDEHHAVRTGAGMFDVSHMCTVDVRGAPCRDFLRYLLANDIDKLTVSGKALYSCMLNPDGGVIDDLIVYYLNEEFFRLVINAGTAEKDLAWMEKIRHEKNFSVTITPRRDLAMIAVQGPEAREKFWQARPAWKAATENLKPFFAQLQGEVMVARTGYTGEDGFEVSLPAEQAAALWADLQQAGVRPCGLGARDTLRLEAGMNLYGNEMDDTVSPLDAGLAWTVRLKDERDFVGRAALLAQGQRFEFLGLVLLNKGVMRGHQTVITAHGTGELTSGTFSPTLGVSIAMARLPLGVQVGNEVQVDIRGKAVPARVVKLPFVRHGKILVSVS